MCEHNLRVVKWSRTESPVNVTHSRKWTRLLQQSSEITYASVGRMKSAVSFKSGIFETNSFTFKPCSRIIVSIVRVVWKTSQATGTTICEPADFLGDHWDDRDHYGCLDRIKFYPDDWDGREVFETIIWEPLTSDWDDRDDLIYPFLLK